MMKTIMMMLTVAAFLHTMRQLRGVECYQGLQIYLPELLKRSHTGNTACDHESPLSLQRKSDQAAGHIILGVEKGVNTECRNK
eukprot:1158515-Pelagomonas_calceolata.AAC.8